MTVAAIKRAHEQYRNAVEEARTILDTAEAENRELTAEEVEAFDRANADIDARKADVQRLQEYEDRTADNDEIERRFAAALNTEPETRTAEDPMTAAVEAFRKGESRSLDLEPVKGESFAEVRDLTKGTTTAGGHTVPTSFYGQLVAHMIANSAILRAGATVLTTEAGENIQVPKTTTHPTAALIAEAGTLTESDAVFGQATLGAYKYGMSTQLSSELVNDTGVDLLGYLARICGEAVGNGFGTHAITGDGSSKPYGIVTNSTLGVTGSASVSGIFTADNLIDLYYSVIEPYRMSSACGWLMRDASMAVVRKLKDTAGNYIWQPAFALGGPETIMGKPVYTDPNVAAYATSAKSVIFGDISRYFVRQVRGIRFERSDEFAFQNDLITFRCIARMDGVLVDQTGAVKHFIGNAS
jgi:HK97 family phage major capsid protein